MALIRNEPMDAYHRNPAISNSKLNNFRENGALWWRLRYIDRVIPDKETEALRIGRAFDSFMFDGQDGFDRQYIVRPDSYVNDKGEAKAWTMASNSCKAWVAAAEARKQTVLSAGEVEAFTAWAEAIHAHALAHELLTLCEKQVSIRRKFPKYGIELQARPDGLCLTGCKLTNGLPFTLDMKTTEDWGDWFDESGEGHQRIGAPIWKFGYHRQGAIDNCLLLLEEDRPSRHFLLVVEKQAPNRVGIVELTEDYLDFGWKQVERDLGRLAKCLTTKVWPGSPAGVVTIAPPAWMQGVEDRLAMTPAAAVARG